MAKATIPGEFDGEFVAGNVKNAMKAAEAKSGDVYNVPIGKLKTFNGFNPRITGTEAYKTGIQELADSMKAEGFYRDKPLAGFVDAEGDILIVEGHRRLEAAALAIAQGALIETLPVVVKPQGTSREDLTVALVRSNTGLPFTPYEIGTVVKRLQGYGLEKPEIARRLGITERYVDDLLLLHGAAKSVRDLVIAGKVSATLAIDQIRSDPKGAADALKQGMETATKAGKKKITSKHVPKKGKKKGKKGTKAAQVPADGAQAGSPPAQLLPEAESRLAGTLDALAVLEVYHEKMPDFVDEIMRKVVEVVGKNELIDLAIKTENYTATGLVRLDLVELQEPESDAAADL